MMTEARRHRSVFCVSECVRGSIVFDISCFCSNLHLMWLLVYELIRSFGYGSMIEKFCSNFDGSRLSAVVIWR